MIRFASVVSHRACARCEKRGGGCSCAKSGSTTPGTLRAAGGRSRPGLLIMGRLVSSPEEGRRVCGGMNYFNKFKNYIPLLFFGDADESFPSVVVRVRLPPGGVVGQSFWSRLDVVAAHPLADGKELTQFFPRVDPFVPFLLGNRT